MSWKKIVSKKLIGKGTFGKVYKVTDEKGAIGALKIIDKQYHKFRIQFKSAFEITRKINDVNYVKALQWISDKDVSWVMEYVDGKPISSLKFTDGDSLDKILKYMIQVCNGLMALHSRNIIHRDLKPQNILLNSNNIVKITDFDFIKIEHTGKQVSQFVGTPVYSSPKHFISSYDLDIRSDLYSLGVILYELVTGKLPFEGKDAKEIGDKHRLKPIILPTKINPDIPKGVEKIITGLLEKNPKDRYQHAHAVAMDLFKEIKNKKGVKIKADIPYLLKPRFVNREISLKTLNELSDELESKNGKVVLILGESGIGKSKLIQQFHHYLQFQNVDFYYSVCKLVEHSLEPLSSIFEEILEAAKSESGKLQYFGRFGWDLVKFGILAEKEWMNKIEKPVELSGKGAEIRLFSAMTNFIQKAATKPLVICIDDLQWADEIILKWLIYTERNLQEFPVLIVGLHRTEQLIEDSLILKIENLIQVKIKNLKGVDVSDMIKSMLGKKSSSRELDNFIKSIVSHTKGNPLFIREILYYLQEKGKITIINNKWNFPPKIEIENLPENIQQVIRERLAELSKETLITLQTASIIGKKFNFEMLLNMTKKNDNELLDDLIDCREVSLIEESGNDYIFIHDKVREVLENEIKEKYPSFWKELHLKAGEFLEEKYSKNPDEVLDDLAKHFYFAEQPEKSVKYNELAGDKANKNYFNNKALNFYEHLIKNIEEQMLILNKRDSDYKKTTTILIDTLLKKGDILQLIGNWKEAEEIYKNALKLSEEIEDKKRTANSYGKLGSQLYIKNNLEKAMECFESSLVIRKELVDKKGISKAVGNIGNVYFNTGNYKRALECYEKSLKIDEEFGDKKGISIILGNMGTVYSNKGNNKKAMECFEKSLKIGEEFGEKKVISNVVGSMGQVYAYQGNYKKAMECFEKSLKIGEELGDKKGISHIVDNIGQVYKEQENYEKAMECFEKAIQIDIELGLKPHLLDHLSNKAECLYDLGEYEEANEANEEYLKIAEEMKDEEHIFSYNVLKVKIEFKTVRKHTLRIKNCIEPLEKLLEKTKDEKQIATLNYELAIMNNELNREKNADRHKKIALELYKKLYKKTPKIEYKNRIEELGKLNKN
ncbi:MAG: tetratricopeptide repeat protein [Candidatus Cloacimonetes bacterium]|nr:tetratricopeptide repeat protein [Candidatus Cloacimonadota bacterium]